MIRMVNGPKWGVVLLLLLILAAYTCIGVAAENAPAPAQPSGYLQYQEPARTGSSPAGAFAYVASLIVLFLGVIALAYFASRFIALKMSGMSQTAGTSIHMTLSLGPNRNIHLVEMAGRFFVVGVTDQSIRLLFEIESPDEINKIKEQAIQAKPSFEAALGNQMDALKQIRDRFPAVFSSSIGAARNQDQEKR